MLLKGRQASLQRGCPCAPEALRDDRPDPPAERNLREGGNYPLRLIGPGDAGKVVLLAEREQSRLVAVLPGAGGNFHHVIGPERGQHAFTVNAKT